MPPIKLGEPPDPVLPVLRSPKTLAEAAADAIRAQIVSGRMRSGQRLVESRLAKSMEVSRAPVREALGLLRAEGLVREDEHGGSYVISLDASDVREIYDLRAAIEARSAKLLVRANVSEPAAAALQHAADAIDDAVQGTDYKKAARADFAFHELVCRLSANRRLHAAFLSFSQQLAALLTADEYYYGSVVRQVHDHQGLLDALRSGNPERAAASFEAHVEQARDALIAHLRGLEADLHQEGRAPDRLPTEGGRPQAD
jgi:DNA-binding GntR family transcriptional regulator